MVIVGAVFDGLSAAMLWIASATYVAACAAPTNRGFFFGFSYAFFLCGMAIANLITWRFLTSLDQVDTVTTLVAVCSLLSALACVCLFSISEPLICQSDEDQGHILQASELSKVNDYFTNKSGVSTVVDSL